MAQDETEGPEGTDGTEAAEAADGAGPQATSSAAGKAAGTTAGKTAGKTVGKTGSKTGSKAARSGNPAKAAGATSTKSMGRTRTPRPVDPFRGPSLGPALSVRFGIALALMIIGIAWIVYYYVGVRPPDGIYGALDAKGKVIEAGGPDWLNKLMRWNYLIGFGLFFLGLIISAHPKTPLGRGRGVVVGMLGCFILGLAWICVYYAIANDTSKLPVFNDLDQKNLIVGIVFMAVGFTFATRWE